MKVLIKFILSLFKKKKVKKSLGSLFVKRGYLYFKKNPSERKSIIKQIIVHCSDSDIPEHDNILTIHNWHLEKGWAGVGYHYYINKEGEVYKGRSLNAKGSHCRGQNKDSIGICFGGKKDFKEKQFVSGATLIQYLMDKYHIHPDKVLPHNFYDKGKTCPNFHINLLNYHINTIPKRRTYDIEL